MNCVEQDFNAPAPFFVARPSSSAVNRKVTLRDWGRRACCCRLLPGRGPSSHREGTRLVRGGGWRHAAVLPYGPPSGNAHWQ